MCDRTFVVKRKTGGADFFCISANRTEIHDEHLILLNSRGKLAALFLMQAVESWIELPDVRVSQESAVPVRGLLNRLPESE
jgi:hypothetical protein